MDTNRRDLLIGGGGIAGGLALASVASAAGSTAAAVPDAPEDHNDIQAALKSRLYFLHTRSEGLARDIPSTIAVLDTFGYANTSDLGGARYARTAREPDHAGKFRSLDRFLPDGTIDRTNGGWWLMIESEANVCAFGAVGDNVTDNYRAFNEAIIFANSASFPMPIRIPRGQYFSSMPLDPITNGIGIRGDDKRSSLIRFAGDFDCITVRGPGNGVRAADVIVRDLSLYCSQMTGGATFNIDYAQGFILENALVISPYNLIRLRQSGETRFIAVDVDRARGDKVVHAYGTGAIRNGEIDKIDVIGWLSCIIRGNYTAGSGAVANDLVYIDGYVQTFTWHDLKILQGGRGIVTANSPGLPINLGPSLFIGSDLEMEQFWEEQLYLPWCASFWSTGGFYAGTDSQCGIYLGPQCDGARFFGGRMASNYKDGLVNDGATGTELHGVEIYRNGLAATTLHITLSGVKIHSGDVTIFGGLIGKKIAFPAYVEHQMYGINNLGGTARAYGAKLAGNASAPTNGPVTLV